MRRTEAGEKPAIAIIGAGRVGTALGTLLAGRGYPIRGVVCRSLDRAREAVARIGSGTPEVEPARGAKRAGIVLVTVPDHAVVEVTKRIAAKRRFRTNDLLIHTSGALSAEALRVRGTENARCASVHPIQTVADRSGGAQTLRGAFFGVEGDPEAASAGEELVRAIGGHPLVIKPGTKGMYHAAACVASNYLVTLIDASLRMYELAGIARSDAMAALTPLLQGTLANVERLGVPWSLTGPIERGDIETVRAHLEVFAASDHPELERVYRLLGLHTLSVAKEKMGELSTAHQGLKELLQGIDQNEVGKGVHQDG